MMWIICGNLPFAFVENEFARKHSKLTKILRNSLMKAIRFTSQSVSEKLKTEMPTKIALIFDGWSDCNSAHYIGVFAGYLCQKTNSPCFPLLAISPPKDQTFYTAEAHKTFIETTLQLYNKTLGNVLFFVGDDCSTNTRLSDITKIPLDVPAIVWISLLGPSWLNMKN